MALLSSYSVRETFQKTAVYTWHFFLKRRSGCGLPEKLTGR